MKIEKDIKTSLHLFNITKSLPNRAKKNETRIDRASQKAGAWTQTEIEFNAVGYVMSGAKAGSAKSTKIDYKMYFWSLNYLYDCIIDVLS